MHKFFMKTIKLKYKGFIGTVQWSKYDKLYYGSILNTSDLVSYQGNTLKEINKDFKDTVDDYIILCAQYNKLFTDKMFFISKIYIFFEMIKKYKKPINIKKIKKRIDLKLINYNNRSPKWKLSIKNVKNKIKNRKYIQLK